MRTLRLTAQHNIRRYCTNPNTCWCFGCSINFYSSLIFLRLSEIAFESKYLGFFLIISFKILYLYNQWKMKCNLLWFQILHLISSCCYFLSRPYITHKEWLGWVAFFSEENNSYLTYWACAFDINTTRLFNAHAQ